VGALALGAGIAFMALLGNCTLPAAAVDQGVTEITPDNVCATSATRNCDARRPCCDASGIGYGRDLCVSDQTNQCLGDLADYKAGQADFKPDQLNACLKQTAEYFSTCSTFAFDDYFKDNACTFTPFQGKRGEGAPCDRDTQCAPPSTPRTLVYCNDHRCTHYRYVAEGQPCQLGPSATINCDTGLWCNSDLSGDPPWGGTCQAGIPVGQPCDTQAPINQCGLAYFCDDVTNTCAPGKPTGAPCTSALQCQSFLCENGQCVSYVANEGVCWRCNWANVTSAAPGQCDPIDQNCPPGQTCSVQNGQTVCVPHAGSATFFAACASDDDCAGGLLCGNGRCTRPCCPALERVLCGYQGRCSLQLGDASATLKACSFSPPCDPWSGSCAGYPESTCAGSQPHCSYFIGTSPSIDQPCSFGNECEDSQVCWTDQGNSLCRWLCKYSNTGAPQSGQVGGPEGGGGCPTGQACKRFNDSTWLGVCLAG
jgi:hypothetical protein